MFEFSKTLKEAEKIKKDFDILGVVLNIKEKSNEKNKSVIPVNICDQTKKATILLKEAEFKRYNLEQGKIIRIRSANYEDNNNNKIYLAQHSNIIVIPSESKTGK